MAKKPNELKEALEHALAQPLPSVAQAEISRLFGFNIPAEDLRGMSFTDVIALQLVARAARGSEAAIKEVMDRVLGKAKQTVDVNGRVEHYTAFLEKIATSETGAIVDAESVALPAPDDLSELL